MEEKKTGKRAFTLSGAIITWFAVILQFYLIILNRVTSVPETVMRFFSFYTILTNIIVAIFFSVLLFKPRSRLGTFLSQAGVVSAITIYITVVGIIYNLVLRSLWKPQGLQRVADEMLHVIVPLLFIFYWLIYRPKYMLQWKNVIGWMIYPLVYMIFILFRGAISGFYPYPFIDVNAFGYPKVLLNAAGVFCIFLLLSLFIVALSNRGKYPRLN